MTEFLLRSITKGKFEEWYPESFSSLKEVVQQIEDFPREQDLLEVWEFSPSNLEGAKPHRCAIMREMTQEVLDMLSDRERKREEDNADRDPDYMDNDQLRKHYTERL